MSDRVIGGRHRPQAMSDNERWSVTVHRYDGGRGQTRRLERRAQRRAGAFTVMATMMTSQAGLLLALALWSHFSLLTRVLLGVGASVAAWAMVFMIVETVSAYRLATKMTGARRSARSVDSSDSDGGSGDTGDGVRRAAAVRPSVGGKPRQSADATTQLIGEYDDDSAGPAGGAELVADHRSPADDGLRP